MPSPSTATPHGLASPEEAIRVGFRALELGASSVYCSASPFLIEAMARERIPVVGKDVLDVYPRKLCFLPHSGKAMVKRLTSAHATELLERELALAPRPAAAGSIDLF